MVFVGVIGTTTWGTTLALILAQRGILVSLWARTPKEAQWLQEAKENPRFLPGLPFPQNLPVTASPSEALAQAQMVIYAVPSASLRHNLRVTMEHFGDSPLVLSACKGLERDTGKRTTQVFKEELPPSLYPRICVLSGPNLAKEIAAGKPASAVVAAHQEDAAIQAQNILTSSTFRVYTNTDVLGVELAGALKNVVALGAGISDGLGYGNNAKAAFITRGLTEIARLGIAAGANPLTFAGLAGMGDLVATAFSPLSRNRHVGEQLAKGRRLDEILTSMDNVAEGVDTTVAALHLAEELGVEMPIAQTTYRVLFQGLEPQRAVAELMGRTPRPEWTGIR